MLHRLELAHVTKRIYKHKEKAVQVYNTQYIAMAVIYNHNSFTTKKITAPAYSCSKLTYKAKPSKLYILNCYSSCNFKITAAQPKPNLLKRFFVENTEVVNFLGPLIYASILAFS
jgi:hypothetical protein